MKNINNISKRIFDLLEVHLAAVIFITLFFCIVVQVFSRYVLNHPLPRLFELSIYSFVWAIFLGAPLAKRYRKHMRFDILYNKFPERVQSIIEIGFDTLTNIVLLVVLVPIIKYTAWSYSIKASVLRIPWTYLLLCYPIFVALLLIHNSVWIYYHIRKLLRKHPPPWESWPWQ